ncbi:naked cuticle-like protein 3 [Scophthalmus maximus]|uniref:naked cuticle-like protein 3 n=1 Tax=Scophthalmus maximus TaxID=52904 RepID=UPI0015E12DD5|nr:naked cuticle-like protein 3 [Scophthalmus maximus]
MGKLQSKLAPRRRQSPEGDSLTSSVLTCQGELEHIHKSKLTENLYVELAENKSERNCNLQLVLPPRKTRDKDKSSHFQVMKKKKSQAGDMSSLTHSVHEVLEASLTPPCFDNTPLRIKLAVTPLVCPDKISQTASEQEQRASQEAGSPVRKLYCVDENIERRNHYLDLAGIENYTSKFDNSESPCQEPRQQTHSAVQHHTVVGREHGISSKSPGNLSILQSQKHRPTSAGKDRSRGEGKHCRLHGLHPASWCHPTRPRPPAHCVPQPIHSKRLRSRVQDAPMPLRHPGSQLHPGEDREMLSKRHLSCRAPLAQRHQHHHQHEHHHHHHHHHYHPS